MRYTHKMWAHSDSGLLLKAVVLDEHDRIIEQYAFTQLKIGGDIDRRWILENKSAQHGATESTPNESAARSTPSESGWIVYALPAGFKKIAEVTRRMRDNQLPVTHLVYSDGLAGISVFIEKLRDKAGVKTGLYSKGVIQVYTKMLDENLLTVVGEVPARTVMQVAESVRYGGHQ
jgi:sigma-E factor negative regulatory protein RseB